MPAHGILIGAGVLALAGAACVARPDMTGAHIRAARGVLGEAPSQLGVTALVPALRGGGGEAALPRAESGATDGRQ